MPTKILKLSINGDGYKFVGMRGDDNQVKSCTVHRLVALAFLPGHDQVVHHKDNNKKNNHISNLEWTTRAENLRIHFREHYKPKKIPLNTNHMENQNVKQLWDAFNLLRDHPAVKLGHVHLIWNEPRNEPNHPHITIYEVKDGKYLKTFYSLNLVAKAQEIGLPAYMDYDTEKEAIFLKIY